jgi:hypothetical protein
MCTDAVFKEHKSLDSLTCILFLVINHKSPTNWCGMAQHLALSSCRWIYSVISNLLVSNTSVMIPQKQKKKQSVIISGCK